MAEPIDDESSGEEAKSAHGPRILAIISNALNKLPATQASADRTAGEIDNIYPSDAAEAEKWLWSFWSIIIGMARMVSAEDERQTLLALTVAKLQTKRDQEVEMWGQRTRVWTELPMLGPVMRDSWSLSPDFNSPDHSEPCSVEEWVSLNSFAARIHGLALLDWHNFAIWEMRFGLEEPIEDRPRVRESIIATSYEWIIHAGRELYKKATEGATLDALETRALMPGSLFKSNQSGLSVERWNFWRERIGVLGAGARKYLVREKAQITVQTMVDIEGGD
ncbi:hypothetical protein E4U53_003607 [Claviceps sorghi]|nr:hypothetical protein E4U53_003607 [Claviceps sorghi]